MTALMSVSTNEHRGSGVYRGRHGPTQQTGRFGGERPSTLVDTSIWQGLPAATQIVLTSLIARLLLNRAEPARWRRPVMTSGKFRPHHLERKALLYVR